VEFDSKIEAGPWLKLPKDGVHFVEQGHLNWIEMPIRKTVGLAKKIVSNASECRHQFQHATAKNADLVLYCVKCGSVKPVNL